MTNEEFREGWLGSRFRSVYRDIREDPRHGTLHWEVFLDISTDRFWAASYKTKNYAQYHGIKENNFDLDEVFQYKSMVEKIIYVRK
jgi:hypothetical protein